MYRTLYRLLSLVDCKLFCMVLSDTLRKLHVKEVSVICRQIFLWYPCYVTGKLKLIDRIAAAGINFLVLKSEMMRRTKEKKRNCAMSIHVK